ncbi:serine hydrolase domain-containing protein [Flagellimonas allohymeniacidonis]|uniref:Class C beta-lactamase-related serine hydrolase n=1 Tax=Flagellimonas allohymeniacidonis TaxID=2517819 RepID=A0A4Q8QGU2_9FLAO|nr:serine hydrolase [Allomuricauda hymeniacidonis]TAI47823.1 class C beta-lactamase-related serine hydrolase [Allomuricauda hymeniacidonis]
MRKSLAILVFLTVSALISCAQNNKQDYQGEWIGFLPDKSSFNFKVTLEKLENNTYHLTIANDKILIDEDLVSSREKGLLSDVDEQLFFDLKYGDDSQALTGFIKSGKLLYHVSIPHVGDNKFVGAWNPFMLDNGLQSDDIMLYMEHTEEGNYLAYPFFGDQRFRGTYTGDFKKQADTLLFRDDNTGFNFRAELLESTIELEIFLTDVLITKTSLRPSDDGWEYTSAPVEQAQNTDTPAQLNDGWSTAHISEYGINKSQLLRLIDGVRAKKLVNTHSVLIAKENNLVFETYFDGFNAHIPHDLRSASKSISSAMIGIGIEDQFIKGVDELLYDYVPQEYQYTKDSLKSKIRIKDLLTMSSGLDVNNLAYEDYYQDPENPNSWLKTVLEAPMVQKPGAYADYGSANPFLLGICLNERLDTPLETYMDEKLFAPLGITNYINQTDDSKVTPYFGGGMLLTPRDLLKFGQLYLNKGQWNGKQILSKSWVEESFEKHVQLQDVRDKNQYGYLWWHDTYTINGREIESIEARGAGGQFIFILPALESVVVITSGNFRNGKGNQSRDILEEFLLPALLN